MPNQSPQTGILKERIRKLRIWYDKFRVLVVCIVIWATVALYAYGYMALVYHRGLIYTPPNVPLQVAGGDPQAKEVQETTRFFTSLLGRGDTPMLTELSQDTKSLADVIAVLQNRSIIWETLLWTAMALSFSTALGAHLFWRARFSRLVCLSRTVSRAKSSYLNTLTLVVAFNCLLAVLLYRFGYAGQAGATLAHYGYMGVLVLSPVAVALTTRFAAPLPISGRGCYFRRL